MCDGTFDDDCAEENTMSIEDIIKEATRKGFDKHEVDIVQEEYGFHLNNYLDARINSSMSAYEATQIMTSGRLYAEGMARSYMKRVIDGWHKQQDTFQRADDNTTVNDK